MIRRCANCGFILGTRPGLYEVDGICGACVNAEIAEDMDWKARQQALAEIAQDAKKQGAGKDHDCVIAVSGGKDSTVITKRLVNDYGLRALLVTVTDEFTHTQAGQHNIKNIAERFNCDHLIWRFKPEEFKRHTKNDFMDSLHPLKWIEERIYKVPVMIAKRFAIPVVFFGENSAFEYGTSKELSTLHPTTDPYAAAYFFFAFERYSEIGNKETAAIYGYKTLDDFNEWQRHGNIENYTQQDSIGYIIQLWTKFVKYGFQRVSDMACRFVRQGLLTREQALQYIRDLDYQCDPTAKRDFCKTVGITAEQFDAAVDKHANRELVEKDANGIWKLREAT